jgi:hypothetical protein
MLARGRSALGRVDDGLTGDELRLGAGVGGDGGAGNVFVKHAGFHHKDDAANGR